MVNLSEYELRLIAKIRDIKNYKNMTREKLLSTLNEIERNLNTISERKLNQIAKMQNLSLIIALLKSKRSVAELFNNNFDDSEISDIRRILNRLRDVLSKRIRKEIKEKIYEIENRENLSEQENEDINEYLTKLIRYLIKKEGNRYPDRDDLDYYGIRDIKSLLGDVDIDDYYEPLLFKTAFKEDKEDESSYRIGYKLYDSQGNKDKLSSAKQSLFKIKPYLRDLIKEHKTPASGQWKIQLNMYTKYWRKS